MLVELEGWCNAAAESQVDKTEVWEPEGPLNVYEEDALGNELVEAV